MAKSNLVSTITKLSKQKIIPATVIDIVGDRCAVRLSGTGKLIANLKYFGTAPSIGMSCHVDYKSGTPIVYTTDGNIEESIDVAISSLPASATGSGGTPIEPITNQYHNDLSDIQGGIPASDGVDAEHYHLTSDEHDTIVLDANIDGKLYVRQDGDWVEEAVQEAPIDGNAWVRQDGEWKPLIPPVADFCTGGNTEWEDDTYHYHVFTGDGTLEVLTGVNVNVLVVAGGGGAGAHPGGGGGAGGLLYQEGRALTVGSKPIVIGGGGAAGTGGGEGTNGNNTTFDGMTALGGGGGGSDGAYKHEGKSGGSGGGDGLYGVSPGGAATQGNSAGATGFGNAGGEDASWSSGGGGGAGGAGGTPITGGIGKTYNISGTNVTYGVGGAGHTNGGAAKPAGTDGRGNGGGSGSKGGSGIVIVRWLLPTVANTNVMYKTIYDSNDDGIVDNAAAIAGTTVDPDIAPNDGDVLAWNTGNNQWEASAGGIGGIEEAPVNGSQYARKDAGWVEVAATPGTGGGSAIGIIEDLTSQINGITNIFELASTLDVDDYGDIINQVSVFYNGLRQDPSHYILEFDDYANGIITLDFIPASPDTLIIEFYSLASEGTVINSLDDITDVNVPSPEDGQVLTWDLGSGKWIAADGGTGGGSALQIDQSGGTGDVHGILAGTLNGVNTEFTVSLGAYISGTLTVYLNGQLQTQGTAEDWHEALPESGTFHFTTAPEATDEITTIYGSPFSLGSNSFVYNETPSGTVDGVNDDYTLANTPIIGTEQIYRNGILQKGGGEDYTITGNAIAFIVPPLAGSVLLASYQKVTSTSGNADTLDGLHAADIIASAGASVLEVQVFS